MQQLSSILYDDFFSLRASYTDEEVFTFFLSHFKLKINLPKLTPSTLFQIFTHKSFSHEMQKRFAHNERLEFLGDAVLDLFVSKILLEDYPDHSEGELSKFRSSLVNEKSLSQFAQVLGLGDCILLGKGELKSEGYKKPSLLADTFEAMLGGIYQELGHAKAEQFFTECLNFFSQITGEEFFDQSSYLDFDAKTKLQELVMKKYKVHPKYECETLDESGEFKINFKINETVIASEIYHSKKKGMQKLAHKILENNLINLDTENLC